MQLIAKLIYSCNMYQLIELYIQNCSHSSYHIVYRHRTHYPINYLHNIAIQHTCKQYVFIGDIDFQPAKGLYTIIKQSIQSVKEHQSIALVVPALEAPHYVFHFPQSKPEAVQMIKNGTLYNFYQHHWQKGAGCHKFH